MKKSTLSLLSIGSLVALSGIIMTLHVQHMDTIYQVATLDDLKTGQYDGQISYNTIEAYGDFGLGTFDKLDGELIALDGDYFQVKSDGRAYPVKGSMTAPFANITSFAADYEETLQQKLSLEELNAYLFEKIQDPNAYFAIRIEGTFDKVTTRSVHSQDEPFQPLEQVLQEQVVFEYKNIEGSMIGFYLPPSVAGKNQAGFHFHFISKDRQSGGHLLDCTVEQVMISMDRSQGLKILHEGSREVLERP